MNGIYRIAAAVPTIKVANPLHNSKEIIDLYLQASQQSAAIVFMPELSLSSCSCADLFMQKKLLVECELALQKICQATAKYNNILLIGLPYLLGHRVYNCIAVIQGGNLIALLAKTFLQNSSSLNETRYFQSWTSACPDTITWQGKEIPFANKFLFQVADSFSFALEFGTDLFVAESFSAALVNQGAEIIFNLAAFPELTKQYKVRKSIIQSQSARLCCVYACTSAGVYESSSDCTFAGRAIISANGKILAENKAFARENSLIFSDIKPDWISALRRKNIIFQEPASEKARVCHLQKVSAAPDLAYFSCSKLPFIPEDSELQKERFAEIFAIQSNALARRFEHISAKKFVIGLSGGLDSTLAFLVCLKCCDILQIPYSSILGITLPCYGTSERTFENACSLTKLTGAELRIIDISKAVEQHFKDIDHQPDLHNVVYENSQARERTQVLMDIANAVNGIVIGTGDLSEIALGWNTYNADHMSMYSVNAAVPKTVISHLIEYFAQDCSTELAKVLRDIVKTPISPELLPEEQLTESIIGDYRLHDFFLYHMMKYGESPKNLLKLAEHCFKDDFSKNEILKTLQLFLRRFFTQQFKRNAMPDAPKIGSIDLSSRKEWQMPADADFTIWLQF